MELKFNDLFFAIVCPESLCRILQREQTCANLDPDNVTIDPELQSINNLYSASENDHENELYFYHTDHLGSSSWITDASGSVYLHGRESCDVGGSGREEDELFKISFDGTSKAYLPMYKIDAVNFENIIRNILFPKSGCNNKRLCYPVKFKQTEEVPIPKNLLK